jgi:lysophospholipase L1-like esterase
VNRLLLPVALGLAATLYAQTPPAPAAPAPARPPIDTHGVDMRTQAGPPGPQKYSPPFPVDPGLPNFWLIGDSTVRNGSAGNGTNLNQWGWGAPLSFYFDPRKVNVVNRALGGTSARSFFDNNWPKMVDLIKPGDVVIMQFGTNDGGNPARSVGELRGIGDETETVTNRRTGQPEVVHTYGWYLRQLIAGTRAKGATPVVCSLIPRKHWDAEGRIRRDRDTFAGWAEQVAQAEHAGFVDLNELSARRLDQLGRAATLILYVPNPTPAKPMGEMVHTGWDGAVMNAECVVSGLKALPDDPVAAWFSAKGRAVAAAAATAAP